MKTLYDSTQVPARAWHYVLDYCITKGYGNIPVFQNDDQLIRLGDLSNQQFWKLFEQISKEDRELNQLK